MKGLKEIATKNLEQAAIDMAKNENRDWEKIKENEREIWRSRVAIAMHTFYLNIEEFVNEKQDELRSRRGIPRIN